MDCFPVFTRLYQHKSGPENLNSNRIINSRISESIVLVYLLGFLSPSWRHIYIIHSLWFISVTKEKKRKISVLQRESWQYKKRKIWYSPPWILFCFFVLFLFGDGKGEKKSIVNISCATAIFGHWHFVCVKCPPHLSFYWEDSFVFSYKARTSCVSLSRVISPPSNCDNSLWLIILCMRCPWCNGYRRRKWTRRHEFKS